MTETASSEEAYTLEYHMLKWKQTKKRHQLLAERLRIIGRKAVDKIVLQAEACS